MGRRTHMDNRKLRSEPQTNLHETTDRNMSRTIPSTRRHADSRQCPYSSKIKFKSFPGEPVGFFDLWLSIVQVLTINRNTSDKTSDRIRRICGGQYQQGDSCACLWALFHNRPSDLPPWCCQTLTSCSSTRFHMGSNKSYSYALQTW